MNHYNKLSTSRLPILPSRRQTPAGARSGSNHSLINQRIGDCFFIAINAIHQIYLQKIGERFPADSTDPEIKKQNRAKSEECKLLRNQARNAVLEAALPLYHITQRDVGAADTPADLDAKAIIIENVFDYAVKEFLAWTEEFVPFDQVSTVESVVMKSALVQREKLERELKNFTFAFRPLVAAGPTSSK
jgi:hypothetical protein